MSSTYKKILNWLKLTIKQTTLQLEEISTDKTKLEQEVRGLLKTLSADKFTKQKSEQAIKVSLDFHVSKY